MNPVKKPQLEGKKGVNIYQVTHDLLLELVYHSKEDFGERVTMRELTHRAVKEFYDKYRNKNVKNK